MKEKEFDDLWWTLQLGAGERYGEVMERTVQPTEDAQSEREHYLQQHSHILAASLQPI